MLKIFKTLIIIYGKWLHNKRKQEVLQDRFLCQQKGSINWVQVD